MDGETWTLVLGMEQATTAAAPEGRSRRWPAAALPAKQGFEAAKPLDWDDIRRAREDLARVSKALANK